MYYVNYDDETQKQARRRTTGTRKVTSPDQEKGETRKPEPPSDADVRETEQSAGLEKESVSAKADMVAEPAAAPKVTRRQIRTVAGRRSNSAAKGAEVPAVPAVELPPQGGEPVDSGPQELNRRPNPQELEESGESSVPDPTVINNYAGERNSDNGLIPNEESTAGKENHYPNYSGRRGPNPRSQRFNQERQIENRDFSSDPNAPVLDISEMHRKPVSELVAMAADLGIEGVGALEKANLIFDIVRATLSQYSALSGSGYLEIIKDGYGFLRSPNDNYLPASGDIFVQAVQVKRFGLKTGDYVAGQVRLPRSDRDRYFTMMNVEKINGKAPEEKRKIIPFESLEPYFPKERLFLERGKEELSMRVFDLVAPLGKGQRGLIVAPPRSGKTVLMQKMAESIMTNNPEVNLIILLIDERPEEVTDMKRMVKEVGSRFDKPREAEVVSSTFDEPPARHAQVAEMVIEKSKRMVEYGHHVVILLDSITRLARAYNTLQPHSGKILTGGFDAAALYKPKHFFGAARNIEGHGSLTIIATALIDDGSKMDEVVFEEFKGTGNMELHLDRSLADRRLYPAINIEKSGTRKEDLLLHPDELNRVWLMRKYLSEMLPGEAMEYLLKRLKTTQTNAEFLIGLGR